MIFAAPGDAAAQNFAERISSYDARIAIQRDASILVTEQITYDFGADQRHGIFPRTPGPCPELSRWSCSVGRYASGDPSSAGPSRSHSWTAGGRSL
ncbi:MAG: DUF2207 domain-containing protein [Streptosporangiaceae bacterium]